MKEEEHHGTSIRSFFAVTLGETACREAAALARRLQSAPDGDAVRWVRPETYHVTLRFLGPIELEQASPLVESVRRTVSGRDGFTLHLGALVAFPPRRPRVLALELAPPEPLVELAAAVEAGVIAAGLAPEPRPFRAHVTLGRLRGRRLPRLDGSPDPAPFPVREVVLFRSDLSSNGSTYTPVERIALGGSESSP